MIDTPVSTEAEAERAVAAMFLGAASAFSMFIAAGELDFARAAAIVALRLAPDETTRSRLYAADPRPLLTAEAVKLVTDAAQALLAGRVSSETSH